LALSKSAIDFEAVKTICALLIIDFFVAIEASVHFKSPHSVFPIAIKYFPLKQSLLRDLNISSSFTLRLLNPSVKSEPYLYNSAGGIDDFICLPSSSTLCGVIALVQGSPLSK